MDIDKHGRNLQLSRVSFRKSIVVLDEPKLKMKPQVQQRWKIFIYNEERSHKQSQNTSLYKRDQLIIRKLNSIAKRIFTVAFHEQQFFWQGNNNPLIYHCTFYGSLFPAENLTQIYTTFYPAIANLCHSVASLCLHLHGNISLLQILISQ